MLLTPEELEESSQPNPQAAAFIASFPADGRPTDPKAMRAGLEAHTSAAVAALGDPPAGQTELHHDIEMRDGYKSTLKIAKPTEGPAGPLIVLAFGGGFVAGSCEQFTEDARILVSLFGATVVSISYRLAPENKFPAAQLDSWDSMKWISENATGPLLSSDPSKGFIMGGVSAGGAITAALSRKFQEEPLAHPLTGQWLCIPSTMHPGIVPEKFKSYYLANDRNTGAGSGLSKDTRALMREALQQDDTSDLRYALNSSTEISGQPRTYLQVDGMDPLRDDGLIYDEMLKEGGVETKLDFYPGCPHGHWFQMPGYEISQRAKVDSIVGLGWLLGKSVSREEAAKSFAG